MTAAADLSQSAARARKVVPGEVETPEVVEAITAFIIYAKKDDKQPAGYQLALSPDINIPLKVDRAPSLDEILMYMTVVDKDIRGQQWAGMAAQANLQMNTILGQQMAAQGLVDQLGDLKTGQPGGRV